MILRGHATISWGAARNPGYHFWNVASQSPFNTRVRICSSRCAPRGVQAICCFLQRAHVLSIPGRSGFYTVRSATDPAERYTVAVHGGFVYSKRAMAQDQVEVMKHLGFVKFALVGHDRGGRVAHRLALDHSEVLTRLVILDIVPTYLLYEHITQEFATIFYLWVPKTHRSRQPADWCTCHHAACRS